MNAHGVTKPTGDSTPDEREREMLSVDFYYEKP